MPATKEGHAMKKILSRVLTTSPLAFFMILSTLIAKTRLPFEHIVELLIVSAICALPLSIVVAPLLIVAENLRDKIRAHQTRQWSRP